MKLLSQLLLVSASIALAMGQFTIPPDFTLPTNLPPLEDIWPRPVVDVPGYGLIKGGTAHSWYTAREYNFFHGLPYAKPISKERRFLVRQNLSIRLNFLLKRYMFLQPAESIGQLDLNEGEVFDAWSINTPCIQRVFGVEECLTVNVFTPNVRQSTENIIRLLNYK